MLDLHGSLPALMTPFKNGEIDWPAYENIIEWQIEQGSTGVVPCGTTGESPTLSHEEHMALVKKCVEVVNKRVPVLAGTGSNSTREAVDFTRHAKECGADAALVVAPYYNKPGPEALYAHYKKLNDACAFPIVVYNVPGRTVIDITTETLARIAGLPHVIGVKDASNDLARPPLLRGLVGDDFIQLSGEDGTVSAFYAQGGHGCISVTANVAPKLCAQQYQAWVDQDYARFAEIRDMLAPLHKALFIEASPQPVKYAASKLGLCTDEVRMPLIPASKACRDAVDAAMEKLK